MEDEFRRHLRDVVQRHYDGSMSAASHAAKLNSDAVRRILANPNHLPDIKTLRAMADAYGWRFADVVYWITGTEDPYEITPVQEAERGLSRMGVPSSVRATLLHVAQLAATSQ